MVTDVAFDEAFDIEGELRSIERDLDDQRRELRAELTAAFRRLNADSLHDATDRDYPFTEPEKRAVRRETVGPPQFLPDREATYRDLVADQRTARERLVDFHRDVFTTVAESEPYTLSVAESTPSLDRPYLELTVRREGRLLVLAVDNPVSEGYVCTDTATYTERDVENALELCAGIDDVAIERLGFLTYNTDLVDFAAIRSETDDPDRLRRRVQVAILEELQSLGYDHVETDGSPLLAFLETLEEYGFRED